MLIIQQNNVKEQNLNKGVNENDLRNIAEQRN